MIGLVIEKAVFLSLDNHLYQFANDIRLQKGTGPTGLNATGKAADVFMLWWDERFLARLDELNLGADLYSRFKDDLDIITDALPLGTRYCSKSREIQYTNPSFRNISKNKYEEKIFQSGNVEENTFYVLNQIANDVDSMLSFTYDVPSNHENQKMPVLDVQVCLDNQGLLLFEFYEKPTKNPHVILASSALSWKSKRTILTQEALRRMRNTSPELGPDVVNHHLSKFMLKLKDSGYSVNFRAEIIRSAQNAYRIMVENDLNGTKPMYRKKDRIISDRLQRGKGRVDWWNAKDQLKDIPTYSSVLFVPPTPGSQLAKRMQAKEQILNMDGQMRIRIMEAPGIKLKNMLINKNPYPILPCHKHECPLCKPTAFSDPSNQKTSKFHCTTPGVGYKISCNLCKEQGVLAVYEGESGRPVVTRLCEHINALRSNNAENPLVKHLEKD